MGNNPSRPAGSESGSPTGPSNRGQSTAQSPSSNVSSVRREPKRRDSIHALTSGKATAAPPSESLASATAYPTLQTRPSNPQSRQRSRTIDSPHGQSHASAERTAAESSSQRADREDNDKYPGPINVPSGHSHEPNNVPRIPSDLPYVTQTHNNRPPRLPLPIEEEDHTPGSPIVSPIEANSGVHNMELEGPIARKQSLFSTTTATDDDDIGDELQPHAFTGGVNRTVPTLIEWKQGGEKVFVTGTFAGWNKKYRLHRSPSNNRLSAVLQLPPGTHHLKFIVDGDMRTSDDMPTTVDFTNILVNYLEVSPSDVPLAPPTSGQTGQGIPTPTQPSDIATDARSEGGSGNARNGEPTSGLSQMSRSFHATVPQYLLDYDKPDDCPEYLLTCTATTEVPSPPSLPMFLSKSILNGTTPMKDDSSVLNMPNHTVLNHLATSAIKDDVLATSATTRYKRKHVTTILYRPTDDDW